MKYNKILAHFLLLMLLVFVNSPVRAEDVWHENEQVKLRLLAVDIESRDDRQVHKGLLQIEMMEGWYSYWRFPGDAGIPLTLTPLEKSGIVDAKIHWPVAERHEDYGMTSYIYKHKTFYPIDFTLEKDFSENANYNGEVRAFFMVCKKVCVPQEFILTLPSFDLENKTRSRNQAMLRLGERHLPHDGDVSGLAISFAVLSKDALVLAARVNGDVSSLDVFVDTNNVVPLTAKPVIELQENSETDVMIKIDAADNVEDLSALLQGKSIHVVVKNDKDAVKRDFSF